MKSILGHLNKYLVRGIFIGMLAILLQQAGGANAATLKFHCGIWNRVPSPSPGYLNAVAGISATDVWAVGSPGLSEHWNGTQWKIVPNRGANGAILNGITAVSATDVWAVGGLADNHAFIEHWDGSQWSTVNSPNPPGSQIVLYGVAAISANDVWAVGADYAVHTAITEHWDGTQWSIIPNPDSQNGLRAVTALSTNDVWAFGVDLQNLHWNGTQWSIVPGKNPPDGDSTFANGAVALSPTNVWMVGSYYTPESDQFTLIEHWDGTQWSFVSSPNISSIANELGEVAATSPTNMWAVGGWDTSGAPPLATEAFSEPLAEHWDGTKWSAVPLSGPGAYSGLSGITAIGGDFWAVGAYVPQGGTSQTYILFYC